MDEVRTTRAVVPRDDMGEPKTDWGKQLVEQMQGLATDFRDFRTEMAAFREQMERVATEFRDFRTEMVPFRVKAESHVATVVGSVKLAIPILIACLAAYIYLAVEVRIATSKADGLKESIDGFKNDMHRTLERLEGKLERGQATGPPSQPPREDWTYVWVEGGHFERVDGDRNALGRLIGSMRTAIRGCPGSA